MSLSEQAREYQDFGPVEAGTRDELLQDWRKDPNIVVEQSEEANLPLDAFANLRAPATPDSPGSTVEWLLYNEGIRMVDTFYQPSSRMQGLPDIDPMKGREPEPLARMMNAYWDCLLYTSPSPRD